MNKPEKIAKNSKKIKEISRILKLFAETYSPYRPHKYNEANVLVEKKRWIYYRELSKWTINITFNGMFLNIILYTWLSYQISLIQTSGYGITIWFLEKLISKLWTSYIQGKVKIARNMPKK